MKENDNRKWVSAEWILERSEYIKNEFVSEWLMYKDDPKSFWEITLLWENGLIIVDNWRHGWKHPLKDFAGHCSRFSPLGDFPKEPPYLKEEIRRIVLHYNPDYGDERICKCGHSYYRHFDTYEDMSAVGCKYCECYSFEEEKSVIK